MLKKGEHVVVSLDPSYRGLLDYEDSGQIVAALLQLGFSQVRETAEGAAIITREYVRLMNEGEMDNIIVTSCPAIVYLVETLSDADSVSGTGSFSDDCPWTLDQRSYGTAYKSSFYRTLCGEKDGGRSRCQNLWMCGCGH